jgi:dipeptidyl aminopeptidase/acylaminoacyl peptidase
MYDVHAHIRLGRVGAVAPSPDGRWLAVAVSRLDRDEKKYVSDLWRVPLDGGPPSRLTRGDHDDSAPCFRADGSLGFLSRRPLVPGARAEEGEDERAQVWLLPADGGEAWPFTDEPLGVRAFRFGGQTLVVLADALEGEEDPRQAVAERNKKGPSALHYTTMPVRFWDHWLAPEAPHFVVHDPEGRRDLTPGADREFRETDWTLSEDGTRLIAIAASLGDDRLPQHVIRVYDTRTGDVREFGARPRTEYSSPRLSADGGRLAVRAETRHTRAVSSFEVVVFDLESGAGTRLAPLWDREAYPQAWLGEGLVVRADDRGEVPLFLLGAEGATRLTPPGGTHDGVSRIPGGDGLVGVFSTFLAPPEPFVLYQGDRIVPARLSGYDRLDFARLERGSARAADGVEIDSMVLVPTRASGPFSTLFWIHGGPVGAWADAWHWRWNPLLAVARGYAVALPNPRGSTGYGHAFTAGIWGNTWGAACYDDLVAAARSLIAQPWVDPARVGAMGGSFGGYMANWIGGNEASAMFGAIVTHASLYDMRAFQGVTDWPAWLVHEFGIAPQDDLEAFDRYSPHRFVTRWRTPALVIHGEKDYRVPISEGLALFEALQSQGTDSELLVFPDENHWILKPRNIVVWYEHIFRFLERHLGPGRRSTPPSPEEAEDVLRQPGSSPVQD